MTKTYTIETVTRNRKNMLGVVTTTVSKEIHCDGVYFCRGDDPAVSESEMIDLVARLNAGMLDSASGPEVDFETSATC